MSLVRLLEIGRSLNAIKDTQSRYRMQRQNLLPKFGLAGSATGYHSVAANLSAQGTARDPHLRGGAMFGANRGSGTECKWGGALQTWVGVLGRAGDCFKKLIGSIGKVTAARAAVRWLAGRQKAAFVPHGKPAEAQFQAELLLDNVTVIRNDLSDGDLGAVAGQRADDVMGSSRSAQTTVAKGQAGAYWERLIARVTGVPIGYQDRTGFHDGVKPAEKEVAWPPFW